MPHIRDEELHEWARTAFRPATLRGSLHALRPTPTLTIGVAEVAVGLGILGVGIAAGVVLRRWWSKRKVPTQVNGYEVLGGKNYFVGIDALGAQ